MINIWPYLKFISSTANDGLAMALFLDQETAKWHFRSSATCYYQSNYSTVEAISECLAQGHKWPFTLPLLLNVKEAGI